jgi:hypothetical protein
MVQTVQSQYPHIEWIDLGNDGTLVECAIMKKDQTGNIFFFEVAKLDTIDRQRVLQIISDRNATNFELWDLMANKVLGNGANALEYFHQLVKVITPNGKIINPQLGRIGAGVVQTKKRVNEAVSSTESPFADVTEEVQTQQRAPSRKR